MPKRTDINKILIIGSGPIIIGQACEFDYSGTQACKALRSLGYEIVLVNSNPATIMTDPETADVTYIEPLNVERLEQIIAKERPDALLPNLGGQSALNLCSELNQAGVLEKYNVQVIGVQVDAIERGEDRIEFKKAMDKLGIEMARSEVAYSVEEALAIADKLGYPVVLRPAYTMGGAGGGLVYNVDGGEYVKDELINFGNSREFGSEFLSTLPHLMMEVAMGLFPVVIFFFIYQLIAGKVPKDQVPRLLIGVTYTYVGIVFFLTGANMGFLPVGQYIGESIASSNLKWLLIPIGMLLGYFIVLAEPAVHVLEKQVEEVTAGSISKKMLSFAMSIAVAIAVGLAMIRALTGISVLWFVGIGYALALLLSFVVPEIFTSIAFDSGGVASGAMTSTFLMPLAIGATYAVGGNIMTDAFGVIAMVALLPPITVQILGLIYKIKLKLAEDETAAAADSAEVIELDPVYADIVELPPHLTLEMPIYKDPTPDEEYPDIIEFDIPV